MCVCVRVFVLSVLSSASVREFSLSRSCTRNHALRHRLTTSNGNTQSITWRHKTEHMYLIINSMEQWELHTHTHTVWRNKVVAGGARQSIDEPRPTSLKNIPHRLAWRFQCWIACGVWRGMTRPHGNDGYKTYTSGIYYICMPAVRLCWYQLLRVVPCLEMARTFVHWKWWRICID